MTEILAGMAACLTGIGLAQALVASRLVASFATKARQNYTVHHPSQPTTPQPFTPEQFTGEPNAPQPPVTVLKPLHGDEPLLWEALATLCRQNYPDWQIVCGVQDTADPAASIVTRLQARFPDVDITLVVDPALHGSNRKVCNLINMMSASRHEILVIADSDVHVRPDYLDRLVTALQQPGVGLVTTLYAGLPAPKTTRTEPAQTLSRSCETTEANASAEAAGPASRPSLPAKFGATQITHGFLPGAVLARALGRQDCLGATMALRRLDLERIGGFHALVNHLADDNVLGRRIAALGMRVALAGTVPLTTVPEASLRALFRHELRWARTIRALEPAGFAASILQYPLAWATLAILLAGGAPWSVALFLLAWATRAFAARSVDSALRPLWTNDHSNRSALAFSCPVWLLPLRDVFSVAVMLTSYGGRQVDWRGHGLHADTPPPPTEQRPPARKSNLPGNPACPATQTFRPIEGTNLR